MTNITQSISNSQYAIPFAVTRVISTFLSILTVPTLVIYFS